jgi:hypothetical protein
MTYAVWWKEWLEQNYNRVQNNKESHPINKTSSTPKLAVIIEPRKHELLKWVCWNFMNLLSPFGWELCVVHGLDNEEFVQNELQELSQLIKIHYYPLPFSNMNETMYNNLLTNKSFWETLPTEAEHLLIFQTDTLLLKGDLSPFLDYDFVGAPWKDNHPHGANGGLSLRRRSGMIRVCTYMKFDAKLHGNEDGYFTLHAAAKGLVRLPTTELGFEKGNRLKSRFSVETIFERACCGMHKAYDHLPHEVIKEVVRVYSI